MKSKSLTLAAIALATALGVVTLNVGPAAAHGSGVAKDEAEAARLFREMMGHGSRMMGHGMMGHGMMGHGMAEKNLSANDVTKIIKGFLAWYGNDRLKVGKVEEKDENTIIAEIVTVDDSLVKRLAVDRKTGRHSRVK